MEFKGTKTFPKYEGGDNYSIDMVFDNEATISIDRRSRYSDKCNMSRGEMEANALLISKAPELLEMLKVARDKFLDLKYEHDSSLKDIQWEIEQLIKDSTTL